MCGIVGYIGPKASTPILLAGLRKLEYRGYDSAGLAVHDGKSVQIRRAVGKLANLEELERSQPLGGSLGIGHTRWATHGRPNETNAHPHVVDGVAVVHNGIIENHLALRQSLEKDGVKFASDTDTEIIAHLVSRALPGCRREGSGLFGAVNAALAQVHGSYAIAVVSTEVPDRMVIARNASPLVIGLGDGETLCASDIPAILQHTRRMVFLEDGDIAELTAEGVRIENAGTVVKRNVRSIDWSPVMAERGGYKHFMLKGS
ncbi:MAG: hypothetical protein U0165_00665 [Polyangiaceae bacterium]